MAQADLLLTLADLRYELQEASEDLDWESVAKIDREIRFYIQPLTEQQRIGALATEIRSLKSTYEGVFAAASVRKGELNHKMKKMRQKKDAMNCYKTALSAGNIELRARA